MVIQEFLKVVYSDHQLVIPWSADQRLPIYDLISEEARLGDISGSTNITGAVVVIVLPDDQASNAPNMANIENWANQGLAKISYVDNVITIDNSWTALLQSAQENGFQIHLGLQSDILSDGEVIPLMVNEQNNLDVDPTLFVPLEDLVVVPSNIDVSLPVLNGSIPQYDIDTDTWSLLDIGTETSVTGTFQVVVGAEDPDNNPIAQIFLEDVAERILINMQSDGQGGVVPTDLQTFITDAESNGMFVAFAMTYNMSGTEILVPLQLTDTGLDFELLPIDDDYISPQQVTGLTTVRSDFFPLENTVADAPNNDSSANSALNNFLAFAELDGFTHHLYTFETPNAGNFAGLGSSYVAANGQSTDAQAGSMTSGTASGTLHYDNNLSVHLFETGDSNANSADTYGDDPGIATHPGNDADRGYNQTTNGNQYLEILPGNNTVGGVRLQFDEDVYGFSLYVMGREDEVSDGNDGLVAKRDVFLDVSLRDSNDNISVTRELTDSGPQGGQQFFAYMLDPQADLVIESVTLVEPLTADNGAIVTQNDLARDIFAIDDLRIVTKFDVSGPGPEGDGNTNGEPVPYEIRDMEIAVQVGVPNGEIPLYNLVTDEDSFQTYDANSISGTLLVAVGLEQGQTNPEPDNETLFTEVLDDIQPLISDVDNDGVAEFNEALENVIIDAENRGLFVEFGLSNAELGNDIIVLLDIDASGKLVLEVDDEMNSGDSPLSLRNIVIVDDVLTVDLWVDPNGQSLESFDFYDVTFDAGVATLDKVEALVSGWTVTDSQPTAGTLNIGGYSLDPITSETAFLKLTFTLTDKTKDLVLNFDDVDTELTVNDTIILEGITEILTSAEPSDGEPVPYEIRDMEIAVQVGVPNGEIPLYNLVTDEDSFQTYEANSISGTLLVAVGLEEGQTNPEPDNETLFTEVLDDIQPLISDADNDGVAEFNEALENIIIAAENKGLFVEFGLSNIELGSDIVVPLDIDTSGKLVLEVDDEMNSGDSPLSLRNIVIVDDVLTVDLWVDPNGQSLESFDFYDVTFDAGVATLDKVEALVSGWTVTDSQPTAGTLNIGGYSLDPITSETGFLKLTFTLTDKTKDLVLNFDDVDTELTVNDTIILEGITRTLSQADTNVENAPPSGTVTIMGDAIVGETLSINQDLQDADGLGDLSYQWAADGTAIEGATSSTYVLTSSEVGKTITVDVSFTDQRGTLESKSSDATAKVVAKAVETSWLILEPQTATADELVLDVRVDGNKLAELAPNLTSVSALTFVLDYNSLEEFEALTGSDQIALFRTKGVISTEITAPLDFNTTMGATFSAFLAPEDISSINASDFGFVNFVKSPAVDLSSILASSDALGVSSNDGKIGELVLNPKADGPVDLKITNIYIAEDPSPVLSDPDGLTFSFEVGGQVLVNYWSETANSGMPAISNQEFEFSSASSTITATTDSVGMMDTQGLLSTAYKAAGISKSAESAISISDVIATLKAAVGITELTNYQEIAADVNQDDQVTISDVIGVLKIAVGIEEGGALILTDQGNEEFTITSNTTELTAVALGDVDGSWANSAVADIL